MADILIQPAVPSLFTHTESASNLIVDSPTADSNNNTTIHHSRTSPNNNNHDNSNNSNNTNKYIGHVSRLRSVFTQYALTLNDLKPGEHRSRYCNHHQGLTSPTRGIADGADENSLSPPILSLPLATTSSSTIIERSRSLSNPRILDTNISNMNSLRNGMSSLTMNENSSSTTTTTTTTTIHNNNNTNEDHTIRFRKAREMFQTLEEEAARTTISLTTAAAAAPTTTTTKSIRQNEQFNDETYQPDLMHDKQKIIIPKINTEHIPDLIIDHRQQQQQQIDYSSKNHDTNSNRIRDIPVQFIGASSSSSPTHSDRSFTSIPIHRTPPSSSSSSAPLILNDDVHYAMVNRKQINPDQHYDFPADAIEQLKKHQRDENESINNMSKPSNEEIANRIVASILPSNILKRMDHLNTIFIKPTTIDRSLPKLSFQESDTQSSIHEEEKHETDHSIQDQQQQQQQEHDDDEQKWIDNPMLNDLDYVHHSSTSSSPIFYEKPGIPEMNDDANADLTLSPNGTRRVKFSNAPIRVYPTYAPSEYNRRNDEIDPFSASAEYELEKRIEKMHVFNIEIEKGPDGLGISVLGMGVGADSGLEKLGIFVKSLNPQGVISQDGRIQIGDQIIEVDDNSLVGVTHTYATNVLKATSGLVRFVIGREKDVENSEILRLIQQSLQMDQERSEISRALQHHHDVYNDRHLNDDGFSNLELNDNVDDDKLDDNTIKTNHHHELAKAHEKNYEQIWSMTEKQSNEESHKLYEFEILKQRYESLEKTLANVEKEKEYYQQIYEQTKKDFEHIEEKYLKAKKLIKELQDRETELREQQSQQAEKTEQQQKRILELIKKIEELEKAMTANSVSNSERVIDNVPLLTRNTKLPSTSTECVIMRPPDIPERIPIRSRTSSGQHLFIPERPPSRNTSGTSSVRIPSTSLEKISNNTNANNNINNYTSNKVNNQLDFEVDRSPLLNHSIQMDKSQIAKARPRNLPSKRLSNPLLDEASNHQNDDLEIKSSNSKISSTEQQTTKSSINHKNNNIITDEFVEVKDWTSDQCIQWLTAQDMTSFIPIFLSRNIDGEKLLLLDSTKMKAMGIKSSKDRDHLKTKLKELKHADLDRIRERLLAQQPTSFQHSVHSGNRLRSSSMTKIKERRLFGGSGGK
ncbi:unnamed protein product [Rotaria sp. Silwood2]|nr:unnamed protein product [Rotaria sp. Silwood2]CAF3018382.1 unnamed protein product [Rotaria sp. Silwood2]CAF4114427.1 unnamed protein product [Rotaria sp. Silwood2]CAF4149672.1 unnamed protein product [Rotaria sp. Silwood2]